MSIDEKQFRELVVRPTLQFLDPVIPYSAVAEELLIFTAAHESLGGTYLQQLNRGPALSIFMIEQPTFDWLVTNVLARDQRPGEPDFPSIRAKVRLLSVSALLVSRVFNELAWNLKLATAIARLRYFVVQEPLPSAMDSRSLATYWAKHYQTTNDPAKINQAIHNYERYVNPND